MIGFDTNILLRLFLAGSPSEDRSSSQFAVAMRLIADGNETYFINHIVIAETIWVLSQKLKHRRDVIATTLQRLLHMANVVVQDAQLVAAALDTFIRYPGDFSDHPIGETNRRNGCRTTYTFDRAASKTPFFTELTR